MHITVITGSPHRRGTSALLADEFIRGAKEAGHKVYRFDAAFEKVHNKFSPWISAAKSGNLLLKQQVLKDEFGIPMTRELWNRGLSDMCNLGVAIEREGIAKGCAEGDERKGGVQKFPLFFPLRHQYKVTQLGID